MKKTALAATAVCLLLAGCYTSKTLLLDLEQAAHPFPNGTWVGEDEEKTTITLEARGSAYLMVDGKTRYDVVMVALDGVDGTFAVAQADEGCAARASECEWEYALAVADGERMREVVPSCDLDWPSISAEVASRSEDGDSCEFDDAAKLQHALAWVASSKHASLTYSRQ
jgi:hypothetical protein